MLGIDPEFGASVLRLWVAAGSAILLILFCVVALFQPQLRLTSSPWGRAGFVLAGALLGGLIASAFADRTSWSNGGAERSTFEMRAQHLNALALAPGSPLACLNALAGESVESACEKTLFGSPANVAAASSYVAAQLSLFSSAATYAQRRGADLEEVLAPLRRSLETDRFGFVAHVLAVRDGCDGQNCKMLALFRDANRLRANLGAAALDRYLAHYALLWAAGSEVPLAEGAQPQAIASSNNQPTHKVVNIDFPSAASIPAVSIMNPEPSGPVLPGVAAAAAANPNPPAPGASPPRHTRRQTASPQSPVAPAPGQSSTAVEPIWPEPMPTAPPVAAPQTASSPAAAAPIPSAPSPPNGSAARTQ
jgi:hypothetical protein